MRGAVCFIALHYSSDQQRIRTSVNVAGLSCKCKLHEGKIESAFNLSFVGSQKDFFSLVGQILIVSKVWSQLSKSPTFLSCSISRSVAVDGYLYFCAPERIVNT